MKKILLFLAMVVGIASSSFALTELGKLSPNKFWPNNSSYSSTLTSTGEFLGSKWTAYAFNNNNNSADWTYIKCGHKSTDYVAYISSVSPISSVIGQFDVEIGATNATLKSCKLYVSSDSSYPEDKTTVISYSNTSTAGTWEFPIPAEAQAANNYYKLEFDCPKKSNGYVQLNSITAYKPDTNDAIADVEMSYDIQADNTAQVTLSCATDGAEIYYGFDGSSFTELYTAPFTISENCTIYARAEKGSERSGVKSISIVIPYTSFKDVIEKAQNNEELTIAGNFSTLNQYDNYLMLTDGTSNILVFGQTDKFTPGTAISKIEGSVNYRTGLFRIIDATLTEGGENALITPTEITTFEGLNYTDNLFDAVQINGCSISGSGTTGYNILLGEESIVLYNHFGLTINNVVDCNITGYVWRYNDVLQICPVVIEGGTVAETVATPVIAPSKLELKADEEISITCETEGAVIYYTIDGTDPTHESTLYEAPFTATGEITVKAIAYYEGEDKTMLPSDIAEKSYHIANPYRNVLTYDNHGDKNNTYFKHTCTIDDVDYAMYGYHNTANGGNQYSMQMNGTDRFCYVMQTGDNVGLALESIEVKFHTDPKVSLVIMASNKPYEVYSDLEYVKNSDNGYDKKAEQDAITANGVKIGEITKDNTTVTFPRDYNYFLLYPTGSNAVYIDEIVINYRDPEELDMTEVPTFADDFEIISDETCFMTSKLPYHPNWNLKYKVNNGEENGVEYDAENEGFTHEEALAAATLHTLSMWFEHYYHDAKSEPVVFNHVTDPKFIVNDFQPSEEGGSTSVIEIPSIGEGVKIYFTLDGTDPVVEDGSETPAQARPRAATQDGEYVIDDKSDLEGTHVISAGIERVVINPISTPENMEKTLKAQAVHTSTGTASSVTTNQVKIDFPTGVTEIEAAADADATYFNLQGVKVTKPEKGTYIRVANGKANKVIVK